MRDDFYDDVVAVVLQQDGVQLALEQGLTGLTFTTTDSVAQTAAAATIRLESERPWRIQGATIRDREATLVVKSEIDRTCQLIFREGAMPAVA